MKNECIARGDGAIPPVLDDVDEGVSAKVSMYSDCQRLFQCRRIVSSHIKLLSAWGG